MVSLTLHVFNNETLATGTKRLNRDRRTAVGEREDGMNNEGRNVGTIVSLFLILATGLAHSQTGLASASGGGSGKTTTSNTNVTSTIHDNDAAGALLLFRSDDYNGSGQATYTSVNNVGSFFDSSGIWHLNLYTQRTGVRTVFIMPNYSAGGQPAAPPAGYYWQNVEITSQCRDANGNTVPFPNLVNGSNTCGFMVDFGYNRTVYKLQVGRVLNAGDPLPGNASVTCNAVNGSGQCVDWTITAGDGATPVVANLYSYTGSRQAPWVFIGQYYNSGRVHLTIP
jgi:hypothetical protein